MQCFQKGLLFVFRKSLHTLFVILLIHGGITDINAIWNIFVTHFYNNLLYQLQNWLNIPENLTNPYHDYSLYFLSKLLKKSEKTLE